MPGMKTVGNEHGRQDERGGDDRPGYLLHGLNGGFLGRHALLDVARHRLYDDDGVIHYHADGQHQSEERERINRKTKTGNSIKVPISETGTASSGISVARQLCKKERRPGLPGPALETTL